MKKIVASAGLSLFAAHAFAATIKIENKSSLEIHEIYFASSVDADWGADRLADSVLEPGDYLTLMDVTPGKWNLRLVDEDEDECVIKGQRFVLSTSFAFSDDDFFDCKLANQ